MPDETETGTDLANDPGAPRSVGMETDTREFSLGKLALGSYTFNAMAGDEVRATLTIRVTADGLRDVPSRPAEDFASVRTLY